MFSPGIEPGTFRVLGGCDNHYTTKTDKKGKLITKNKNNSYRRSSYTYIETLLQMS